jgi:hypothetical protein
MAEPRSDDLLRSRQEAALLLRLDPSNLSPSDALRCDLIATLRLSIDSAQADALEGRAADLGRLIVATESLVKLLPSEPPKPESQRDDPRVVLWNIIKEGRDRAALGFEGYDGKCKQIEALQAEVAALKAQLVGAGLAPALPVVPNSTAITPPLSDIVPPSERAECDAGVKPGPDDWRARRSTTVIEGRPNPPPAAPAYDYNREQGWKDYVEPDGTIRTTPRGRGHYWGPV